MQLSKQNKATAGQHACGREYLAVALFCFGNSTCAHVHSRLGTHNTCILAYPECDIAHPTEACNKLL